MSKANLLDRRAVVSTILKDRKGMVAHVQYINDQMLEPDYDSAMLVVRAEVAKH